MGTSELDKAVCIEAEGQEKPSAAALHHLVVLDCDTKRFTIEALGSSSILCEWTNEVNRSRDAGRSIFCFPIQHLDESEAMRTVIDLGYEYWPPRTIVNLPSHAGNSCLEDATARGSVDGAPSATSESRVRQNR